HNYGASWAVSYNFYKKYMLSANGNYNAITEDKERDVYVTGFNTPRWSASVSFGDREVTKNIGFNIVWRWQNSFLWESPVANGIVSSYQTVDAQASVKVPRYKTTIKVGGSNIFNQRYIQYAAGPTIGGLYYLSITSDGLLSK